MNWPHASLVVLTLLAAVPAQAKPPVASLPNATKHAEELNAQAKQAFHDGQFDQAADLFMQVYDAAKTPNAVFNAARAREQARKLPEARALLELYLKIEKTPAGLADGQSHLLAIDAAIAAQAQAEADSRKKAEAAAAETARQAEAARLELERQKAERAKADAERARQEALHKSSDGVAILPPTGTTGEETERVAREVQAAVLREALDAAVGKVIPATDYLRAEQSRPTVGMGAQCDFRCRLEVARSLGAAYAVTTALRQEGKELRVRLVLWQTSDAAELMAVEATGLTLAGVSARGQRVAGDLFNGIRHFPLAALPLPAGVTAPDVATVALTSEPPGALANVDEMDIGATPLTLHLALGPHRLRLSHPGFHNRAGALTPVGYPQKLAVVLPQQLPTESPPVLVAPPPVVPPLAVAPPPVAPPPAVAPAPPITPVAAVSPPVAPKSAEPSKPATAEKPVESTESLKDEGAKPSDASKGGSGLVWGVVPHLEGGLAMVNDASQQTSADVNWGAGGFVHLSSAAEDEAPLVSWVVGARYQKFAGVLAPNDPPAAKPGGVAVWTGVLFPRLAGLCASLNYNHVNVHSGQPSFDYLTGQLRLMTGKGLFYYSVGADFMLKSLRPTAEYDDVQAGPLARITMEIGLNIGGTPLSK